MHWAYWLISGAAAMILLVGAGAGWYMIFTFGYYLVDRRNLAAAQSEEALAAEIQRQRSWRFVKTVLREWLVSWWLTLIYPLGFIDWDRLRGKPGDDGALPILMVHGYSQNRSNFFLICLRLRWRGRKRLYSLNFNPPWGSIEQFAVQLRAKVEKIRAETGCAKVDLLAHSMGGLISRYYLAALGGAAHVRLLITLSTPHHGTRLSVLGVGEVARQMMVHGKFLPALEELEKTAPAVPWISIFSLADNVVSPPESCHLPAPRRNVVFDDLGHHSPFADRRVFEAIWTGLTVTGNAA